jgi:hypothetical protein
VRGTLQNNSSTGNKYLDRIRLFSRKNSEKQATKTGQVGSLWRCRPTARKLNTPRDLNIDRPHRFNAFAFEVNRVPWLPIDLYSAFVHTQNSGTRKPTSVSGCAVMPVNAGTIRVADQLFDWFPSEPDGTGAIGFCRGPAITWVWDVILAYNLNIRLLA